MFCVAAPAPEANVSAAESTTTLTAENRLRQKCMRVLLFRIFPGAANGRAQSSYSRSGASAIPRIGDPPEWLLEVYAAENRNRDECRGDPVNDHTERRPPPGVGHKLAAMLPQVFEPVADEAGDD